MSRKSNEKDARFSPRELFCPEGNRTLRFFEMGDPADQIMLLLPGWMMTSPKMYPKLAKAFVDKNYRVIMPVQAGHGGTENLGNEELTSEKLADWNLHFLADLPDVNQPVSVFANSIMGPTAAYMQAKSPGTIANITLLNSVGGQPWKDGVTMSDRPRSDWTLAFLRETWQRRGAEITWKFWSEAMPNIVGNVRGMFAWSEMGRTSDIRDIDRLLSGVPGVEKVSLVGQIFHGQQDRVVTADSARELGDVLGLPRFSIERATHGTPLVAPELWIDHVEPAARSRSLQLAF